VPICVVFMAADRPETDAKEDVVNFSFRKPRPGWRNRVEGEFPSAQAARRQSFGLGGAVFAAVLLLRLLVLSRFSASPFLLPTGGDMHFYNDWALRILHGELSDHLPFYGLPGYAYMLAFLYKVFGYNPFIPGVFQAVLDSGTAWLVYQITLCLFSKEDRPAITAPPGEMRPVIFAAERETVAMLAALGWGFFVPAQAYSAILMPTAWLVFSFWFVLWRIVRKKTALTSTECLLLGLLIGVMATAVAMILFLIPLVLAVVVLRTTNSRQRQSLVAAAFLLNGAAAGTSPCWIHNYFVARDRVILSAHSGINFWIGNNPEANGYPRFPPGLRAGQAAMLEDSVNAAERAVGRRLKRSEVSEYWSDKAKTYITQHPFAWSRLLFVKLHNIWSAFQYDDLSIITSLRENRIIVGGLYFGLIAALALPGMLLLWRTSAAARWVLAAISLHVIALLTVFVTERYRLVIVPGLLIFAALGLHILWRSLIAAQFTRLAVYVSLLLPSILITSWPQRDPSLWALDAYNSGQQALEAGDLPRAEQKLLLARSYVATNPETNFALANLRLAQGQNDLAASLYFATLTFDQKHSGALNNLGVMALQQNHYADAEGWFRQLARVEPRNAKAHYLLAKTLFSRNQKQEAKSEIETAIQLRPEQNEFQELRDNIEAVPR
jgi:tetratricopeptide (TPR) repeat protein